MKERKMSYFVLVHRSVEERVSIDMRVVSQVHAFI